MQCAEKITKMNDDLGVVYDFELAREIDRAIAQAVAVATKELVTYVENFAETARRASESSCVLETQIHLLTQQETATAIHLGMLRILQRHTPPDGKGKT